MSAMRKNLEGGRKGISKMITFEQAKKLDATLRVMLDSGRTLEECVAVLVEQKKRLIAALQYLRSIAPLKVTRPDGGTFILRCPDDQVPLDTEVASVLGDGLMSEFSEPAVGDWVPKSYENEIDQAVLGFSWFKKSAGKNQSVCSRVRGVVVSTEMGKRPSGVNSGVDVKSVGEEQYLEDLKQRKHEDAFLW